MGKFFLGIDYGTGGGKSCITDEELNVLAYAFKEYPIIVRNPGWAEHDPKNYWDIACECIKECIAKSGINPREIACISTSAAMPSMVMIDKTGNPIDLAYNLLDRRATVQADWLRNNFGQQKYYELSGNRIEDHPEIINLRWEKENNYDSYKRIYKVLSMDGYVKYKLTGVTDINYSEATFLGGFDIIKKEFDTAFWDMMSVDPAFIPACSPCEQVIGTVTEAAAKETGLAVGTPVVSGQVDACAGWIGGGAIEKGDIQMNLGTCGNFGLVYDSPDFIDTMIQWSYTVNCKQNYVIASTTLTGGQSIRYLRDNFSPLEVAVEKVSGIDAYDIMNKEAEKIPAGSDGLIVLPFLMGERTPIWDVNARGVIFGLSLNHKMAHVIRAMMESVAYALYDSFEIFLKANMQINYPLILNEGGAKSRLWRKIITDVFNVPTAMVKNRIGAPYGNCLHAAVSIGHFKDYSIAKQKAEYIEQLEPDFKQHEIYMDYFSAYKNLYQSVKGNFTELKRLRDKRQ